MKGSNDFPRGSLIAGWAAVAVLLAATNARGDDSADTAAARLLGSDGVTLADSGNCRQAIDKLRRAERLHHAPTTAARLGECEVEVGKLVEGTEQLQRVVREPLPSGAPQAFSDAVVRARTVLERALPRLAALRVSVHAPAGTHFTVTVDGEPMPEALLDADRPTDPGSHRVQVAAIGYFTSSKEFALSDAETKSVSLELDRNFNAPLPSAVRQQKRDVSIAAPRESAGISAAPVVALGVSALALGTGIVAGLVVAGKASDLAGTCDTSRVCPPSKESEIAAAKSWATVSSVGFGLAAAAAAAGIVLAITVKSESHQHSTSPSASAVVGPGFLSVRGKF